MSFEIARNINGPHTLTGGPAGDGVFFGTLPAAVLPIGFLTKLTVAGVFPRVTVVDANGSVSSNDETTDASVLPGDFGFVNSTSPGDDRILFGVPAGKSINGFSLRISTLAVWSVTAPAWVCRYWSGSAWVSIALDAASTSPSQIASGQVSNLLDVVFASALNTDLIGLDPNYDRYIEVRLSGVNSVSTPPRFDRAFPRWSIPSNEFLTLTSLIQPMTGHSYASWPDTGIIRAGDESYLIFDEWPVIRRWITDRANGAQSVTSVSKYSSATGLKDVASGYFNEPALFGRAAAGEYNERFAKPADAAKMWFLTYTLNSETHTIVTQSEPALPVGAVEVLKRRGFFVGLRYTGNSTGLINLFQARIEARLLDPAAMTSALVIQAADTLKFVSIDAEEATGAPGESSWFLANAATGSGLLIRDTLTLTKTEMGLTGQSLARSAASGLLMVKISDKAAANAEAQNGEIIISG